MIFLAVLEYALLASTFTIAKVAIDYADPLFLTGIRMVVAAPFMFLVHYFRGESSFKIHKKDINLFILISVVHIFLPFVCEFWALQFLSSAKTAITYALTPFVAALLSYFLLKKKLNTRQSLGLTIGLLGLLPIFLSGEGLVMDEFWRVSSPELVLLFAVISASYAWFLITDLMHRGYGISFINGVAMFLGGLMSLFVWYLFSGDEYPIRGDFSSFFWWTALLILVANIISYNLYGWLLRHLSINFMSALGFLCPIFASLYGVFFLHEHLGLSHLLALVMVCFGLWLFYREEMRKKMPLKNQ